MTDTFDFDQFLALPRLSGLRLSPDGRRLVVSVARPAPDGKSFRSALWQMDPEGTAAPRRLTRSAKGEGDSGFLPDGSLVFTSARQDPDAKPGEGGDDDKPRNGVWLLPADGGEARLLVAPDGGADSIATARGTAALAFGAPVHVGATSLAEDAALEKRRKDAGVGAILFEDYPIRHWDEWLGPRHRRLFGIRLDEPTSTAQAPDAAAANGQVGEAEPRVQPRDLTGDRGQAYVEAAMAVSPDGRTLYTTHRDPARLPLITIDLASIDVASGEERLLTGGDAWYADPKVSPDGRWVVCRRETWGDPEHASRSTLWVHDVAAGTGRILAEGWDAWPESAEWTADSTAILATAGQDGHVAVFRIELADEHVTCLVPEGHLSDLCPAPDGETVYALRSTVETPARVVRFRARGEGQQAEDVAAGIDDGGFVGPGRVERLETTAADGTRVASWLVLPPDAAAERPAPLVVWAHGGPLGSWSGWHWRWNPHLLAARGYAVLLPDPAISTGYGQAMIERGWGRWGEAPYTDIMAATDAALARPDLDAERTALMGGSFGGYMANWVATQTDRFRCLVTHASLWELRGFHGTTDTGTFWEYEMGDPYREPEGYLVHSPYEQLAGIRTPMLVIHGEQDFRVPVSEALRLWTDLRRHGVPGRFLYFPDENHWILKPQNARLWYETVLAFLDEHVLGQEWTRPALV
ncbi:MAG TPA: S9 family peptidase [Candidatus Limnocylindrales bacterium]